MSCLRYALALFMTLALNCLSVNGVASDAMPKTPGIHDLEFALDDGRRGRATVSVPTERDPETPLILVLHYAGEPTPWYGRPLIEELIEPALRTLNAVYLAPETLGGPWHGEANEAWVMSLLDNAIAEYEIAPDRIVISGYSMGAMGTWHLIEQYPERFSAAVPISGFPNHALTCRLPVYTLHAPSDELFAFDTLAERVAQSQDEGCKIHLESVPAHGHFDLQGFRGPLGAVAQWLNDIWSGASAER